MIASGDPATGQLFADLYSVDGKAEIIDGRIVLRSPTGGRPGLASGAIYRSLCSYEKKGHGWAYPYNVGFIVSLPQRKSFCPDAAFCHAPPDMDFVDGASDFAAEVRSAGDYGPSMEREMAEKRADYFAAGTKVVWDVDLLSDDVVPAYRAESPEQPTVYHRGETAEAAPAVPGWKFAVDELFE